MRHLIFLSLVLVACGGGSADVAASGDAGSVGSVGNVSSGPTLTLALRGSTTPVPHDDGLAAQTPGHQIAAIRSLTLYRTPADPDPVQVFDLNDKAVEADLVTGDTIDIATVPLASIPAGTYTYAKVGTAYVEYAVNSRLHSALGAVDGQYNNIEVLSDGALIDGIARSKGWYRFQFAVGATTYGSVEGDGAPIPAVPSGGGITLDASGTQSFYEFPTLVVIDHSATVDQRAICDVNVDHSFRWMDEPLPDYSVGVYDTTEASYGTVVSFGANSFQLSLAPK